MPPHPPTILNDRSHAIAAPHCQDLRAEPCSSRARAAAMVFTVRTITTATHFADSLPTCPLAVSSAAAKSDRCRAPLIYTGIQARSLSSANSNSPIPAHPEEPFFKPESQLAGYTRHLTTRPEPCFHACF